MSTVPEALPVAPEAMDSFSPADVISALRRGKLKFGIVGGIIADAVAKNPAGAQK